MNLELMRYGYLPIVIEVESRQDYYDALDIVGVKSDFSKIFEYITV